jgi:hypothetical protein
MKFFHSTNQESAESILTDGFVDVVGKSDDGRSYNGVWLSTVPLDTTDGTNGNVLLEVHMDVLEIEVRKFEWIDGAKPYREWVMPAAFVNSRATIRRSNSV